MIISQLQKPSICAWDLQTCTTVSAAFSLQPLCIPWWESGVLEYRMQVYVKWLMSGAMAWGSLKTEGRGVRTQGQSPVTLARYSSIHCWIQTWSGVGKPTSPGKERPETYKQKQLQVTWSWDTLAFWQLEWKVYVEHTEHETAEGLSNWGKKEFLSANYPKLMLIKHKTKSQK